MLATYQNVHVCIYGTCQQGVRIGGVETLLQPKFLCLYLWVVATYTHLVERYQVFAEPDVVYIQW